MKTIKKSDVKKEDVYILKCFLNSKRKPNHKLTKKEAKCFLICSEHMIKYLKKEYKL